MSRIAMSMALASSQNQVTSKLNCPLTYRRRINRISLAYICYCGEIITKIGFIFADFEKYPYICQKRKEETL